MTKSIFDKIIEGLIEAAKAVRSPVCKKCGVPLTLQSKCWHDECPQGGDNGNKATSSNLRAGKPGA